MIRVVRVLEYTYDTIELALRDQTHYQTGINGVYRPNAYTTIRSTTLPLQVVDEPHKETVPCGETTSEKDDHGQPLGMCDRPLGHGDLVSDLLDAAMAAGRHSETRDGELWAEWS